MNWEIDDREILLSYTVIDQNVEKHDNSNQNQDWEQNI